MNLKKKSIRTKIVLLLIFFSLFLGLSISIFSMFVTKSEYNNFYSEKTQQTVRFAATLIDGNELERFMPFIDDAPDFTDDEARRSYFSHIVQDDYFKKIQDILDDMKANQEVLYLYIFYPQDDQFTYIMEALIDGDDPEKIAEIGMVYEYTEIERKYLVPDIEAKRPSGDLVLAGDSFFGEVLSAWAPIMNDEGDVVAIIEADASLAMVTAHLNRYLVLILGLIVLIIVLTVSVLYSITQRVIIVPINQLNDKMYHYGTGDELEHIENEIFTGDEIQTLSETFSKMVGDIQEYITNLAAVTAERERVETELNVAKQIQASMLPYIFPPFPDRDEFDIYALMNPAKEVGGDFYDFFMINDHQVGIVMADVSGKGIPAALFMMVSKLLIKNLAMSGLSVEQVFRKANDQLNESNDTFMFVTAFLGVLNLETGDLAYVNAGHNPPLVRRGDGDFEWLEMEKNQILAVMPDVDFVEQHIAFDKGDMIFTYTDGVTEAVNDLHEFYTDPRLKQVLNGIDNLGESSIKAIVTRVRESIDEFSDGAEQADDITILLLKYFK